MVTILHLMIDAKFSRKFMLKLHQNSLDKPNSKVALTQFNIAGCSWYSSLSLDRQINDYGIDLVAVSESHGQMQDSKFMMCTSLEGKYKDMSC